MPQQTRVLIALPTYGEEIHVNFALSLMRVTQALAEAGASHQIMHIASSHIIRARNVFANFFMSQPECTHLLFLDTDMSFDGNLVKRLLAADKCVAAVVCPYRRFSLDQKIEQADVGLTLREWLEKTADYNVHALSDENGSTAIRNGLIPAHHVGTGIFLARRDAFELARPFTESYDPPNQYRNMLPNPEFHAYFDTMKENGMYLSEDLSFCRRVRLGGGEIWALVDETIVHYGSSQVSGQYLRAMARRGKTNS